jgi:hypothetical protein
MNDNLPRRNVLAAMTLPAGFALAAMPAPVLRGDDSARLSDHARLWSRMPLPFTPADAWHLLSPVTQAEIGAAVIGMHLAQYVHGDSMAEADCFRDSDLREAASEVEHDILNRITITLKRTLGGVAPAKVRASVDLLLPSLGRAIARGSGRH